MTTHQIEMVQQSWERIKPGAQSAGELFYQKLFEKAPQVRHMFRSDISEQAGKLTYMLTYVVNRLDKLDTMVDDVQKLAVRHDKYGAEPEHYMVVGDCLLETLQEGLGEDWNHQLMRAWAAAYGTLANAMIQAQLQSRQNRA